MAIKFPKMKTLTPEILTGVNIVTGSDSTSVNIVSQPKPPGVNVYGTKIKSVREAIANNPETSSRKLAKLLGCSPTLVANERKRLQNYTPKIWSKERTFNSILKLLDKGDWTKDEDCLWLISKLKEELGV